MQMCRQSVSKHRDEAVLTHLPAKVFDAHYSKELVVGLTRFTMKNRFCQTVPILDR